MFAKGLPQRGIFRQNQNAFMIVAELQLPSGTHHALRQFATDLAFLNNKRLLALLYWHRCTQGRQRHLVSCLKIGGATYNL